MNLLNLIISFLEQIYLRDYINYKSHANSHDFFDNDKILYDFDFINLNHTILFNKYTISKTKMELLGNYLSIDKKSLNALKINKIKDISEIEDYEPFFIDYAELYLYYCLNHYKNVKCFIEIKKYLIKIGIEFDKIDK